MPVHNLHTGSPLHSWMILAKIIVCSPFFLRVGYLSRWTFLVLNIYTLVYKNQNESGILGVSMFFGPGPMESEVGPGSLCLGWLWSSATGQLFFSQPKVLLFIRPLSCLHGLFVRPLSCLQGLPSSCVCVHASSKFFPFGAILGTQGLVYAKYGSVAKLFFLFFFFSFVFSGRVPLSFPSLQEFVMLLP